MTERQPVINKKNNRFKSIQSKLKKVNYINLLFNVAIIVNLLFAIIQLIIGGNYEYYFLITLLFLILRGVLNIINILMYLLRAITDCITIITLLFRSRD